MLQKQLPYHPFLKFEQKKMISASNHEKYLKSKNCRKRSLGALIKSYEQTLNFIIQKLNRFFPRRKLVEKFIKCVSGTQTSSDFFQKNQMKKRYDSSSSKI